MIFRLREVIDQRHSLLPFVLARVQFRARHEDGGTSLL